MANKHTYWQMHLDGWCQSGLSQSSYGRQHGLSLSSFGYSVSYILDAGGNKIVDWVYDVRASRKS